MTLNDLKGLQMSLCVSNKLSEVIWSHLSHEATKLVYYKNAMLLKNALSFFCQSVLQTLEIVVDRHFFISHIYKRQLGMPI